MYVRCPIDNEDPEVPRRFALGQIIEYNELLCEVKVRFYELINQLSMSDLYGIDNTQVFSVDEVVRCNIYPNIEVKINSTTKGSVICNAYNKGSYYSYYIQYIENGVNTVNVFSEEQLQVPFSGSDVFPISQLKNYEFHNPVWYHNRQIVSEALHTLKSATFGFETLVGSRVFLMPHQVDTIVRAIGETPCRFMLADEVGLGKTIQAAVIKKGLEQRLGNMKVLIIAPESIIYQWKNEFSYKFWENIPVWKEEETLSDQLIFPLEKVNTDIGIKILRAKWDLCIIDETHRLLHLSSEYNIIKRLSKRVNHLLLLSATPIQDRRTEYLKLLTLLQPEKYSDITESDFDILLKKQSYLSGKVHSLVRDLSDYYIDELAEDYLDELKEISEELNDLILEQLISNIKIDSNDQGLSAVRLALAYIAEHYQIERKIIRHRRKELGDKLASRALEQISYDMRGADELFYEYETYDMLLTYLNNFNEKDVEYKRVLLSAMFSSPFALASTLNERKEIIRSHSRGAMVSIGVKSAHRSLETTAVLVNEELLINDLIEITDRWKGASLLELTRVDEMLDDPDLIKGRLMKVVDYISESLSNKIVIFTSWKETLLELEKIISKKFGSDSVCSFYHGMSDQELQQSVDVFQNSVRCKVMLCDELGGEGRNFQIADEVLHVDLPWSPSMLEQRIGRLDRIGRQKEVLSVVFVSEQTLEFDLFQLWDKGLNIFNESLSGLEIALGDINEQIDNALTTNIRYGLSDVLETMKSSLEEMRKKVEVERYYDMARQLDENVQEQLTNLINKFDGNNGELLAKTMMSWAHLAGLKGISSHREQVTIFKPQGVSLKSMKNTLLIPPFNMQEAHRRAKHTGEIRGTFDRRKAVEQEDLIFYAPEDPFFDAIIDNASSSDLGRCCAFLRKNADINWKGFVLTWSASIDPGYLLEEDQGIENLVLAQGYMPLQQTYTIHGYDELDQSIDEETVRYILQSHDNRSTDEHLGKRSNGRIKQFKEQFPLDEWLPKIEDVYDQSYNNVKLQISKRIDIERAQNDFQRRLDGMKAANLYFNKNDIYHDEEIKNLSNIYGALLKGLKYPKLTLESIAFVWLVK